MSSLQSYIDQNAQEIEHSLAAIAELQKQLQDLTQQVRIQQQLNQAQKTANKEVEDVKSQVRKLFKDLCSVFPKEAISDLGDELKQMSDDVVQEYEHYAESSRFLSGTTEEEEQPQASEFPLIVEALPPEDDEITLLSSSQIEQVIQAWDDTTIEFVKKQLKISGRVKRKNAIAAKIAEAKITHKMLLNLLNAAELTRSWQPPALNSQNPL